MLTFLLQCVSFVGCCQGLRLLHCSFPKCGPRNAFWQPGKDHVAKCILTSRAKESVLSTPNVSQGLCTAESWTAAWDQLSAHSRWISALLVLMGFGLIQSARRTLCNSSLFCAESADHYDVFGIKHCRKRKQYFLTHHDLLYLSKLLYWRGDVRPNINPFSKEHFDRNTVFLDLNYYYNLQCSWYKKLT